MNPLDDAPAAERLAALLQRIRECRICRDAPRGAPLPHEPRPVLRVSSTARLCLCSQAPGTRVHASGTPFTDPSGDRLRSWMGVTAEEFYDLGRLAIVPMGFCFPGLDANGGDLPPRRECAPAWREALFAALPQFELVLLVGQYAQRWHLGTRAQASLTDTVANWRSYVAPGAGTKFLPMPHPSWRNNHWLKRYPWYEAELLPFLRQEVRRLIGQPRTPDPANGSGEKTNPNFLETP
jgi:uracil-DNA glycosylase